MLTILDQLPRTANEAAHLPVCKDLVFPVHVKKTVEGEFSLENYTIDALYAWAGREVLVSGDYEMSARLCEPATGIQRRETLQLLIHGATFNKAMWDFPYKPEEYSWTRSMTNAGYTTLAIDLIGKGTPEIRSVSRLSDCF